MKLTTLGLTKFHKNVSHSLKLLVTCHLDALGPCLIEIEKGVVLIMCICIKVLLRSIMILFVFAVAAANDVVPETQQLKTEANNKHCG